MFISLQWLREFVPYTGTVQDLADRLTMQGLEVEAILDPFASIAKIVVGHVVDRAQHPEADKLSVCTVDVGGPEALQIVCGAPNVAKGQNVPVALMGTTMPGGMEIKKAKLRGVVSCGMICSERELGLSEEHAGIMVLPAEFKPGQLLVDALKLEREVIEVSITPNRADCLSVLGIAREAALGFGLPLSMPKLNLVEDEGAGDATKVVRIDIADGELCPVYRARVLTGASIGKSPDWMRYRLLAIGQRPISNIVDVTNYILMELGQPLHAFDRTLLKGDVIRVAPAKDGQSITTLDGAERKLLGSDLLIWDAERPVALAGVMGGANSSISDASTEVLLECAIFRPGTIRKTARRLALPSEASYRFERGVDQVGSLFALNRAAQLMAEVSGARVLKGIACAEPKPWADRSHIFRIDRCNALLGLNLTPEFCRTTLTGLGCGVDFPNEGADPACWQVSSPSHRLDLEREVDLFEECGRVHGLDRIPAVLPKISKALDSVQLSDTEFGFLQGLKAWAVGAGLREAVNYSFVGTDDLDRLNLPVEGRIMIANPLSEDQNVLRLEIAPGLLNNVRHNLSQGNASLRLFEVAKAFVADPASDTSARENSRLGLLVHGARHSQEWPWEQGEADYLDAKGLVENLLTHYRLGSADYVLEPGHAYLEPCVRVELPGKNGPTLIGRIGRVQPKIADAYHARKDIWLADLDADLLRSLTRATKPVFKSLPKFPPVRRDVTVICPATLKASEVEAAIRELKPKLLESLALVAVYAPEGSPERNLTFRLTYRHAERTLVDKEVDKEHGKVLGGLPQKLPVRI
ncbi:MAG: phenylalanine--tRNA ligase subunit beta [Humidesulfovibrio sp.]|uniref:phenylalanine--tRNA ligase subunit beta n=1 Tax=Humidesulfovibrio sp. TaxID=2910988 RepID=UPI0027E666C7|nr:phenylalanine--tRNA ligase subunit beta [Humidesulfovibrio sp.]MDQ7836240.1 phenylalanine--tRNA ligase subunit beta [Humidesulfovibrio sp.]